MSSERDKSFETARDSLATAQQAFASVQEPAAVPVDLVLVAFDIVGGLGFDHCEQHRAGLL